VVDWLRAVYAVRAAAYGYQTRLPGGEAPQVPVEDVLAALAQMVEVRANLDALELDMVRAARGREASWQRIADSPGLDTRQSAESRALRLERAVQHHGSSGQDVAAQRLNRARQRTADAWCRERRPGDAGAGASLRTAGPARSRRAGGRPGPRRRARAAGGPGRCQPSPAVSETLTPAWEPQRGAPTWADLSFSQVGPECGVSRSRGRPG
jgi:hypothetical protein